MWWRYETSFGWIITVNPHLHVITSSRSIQRSESCEAIDRILKMEFPGFTNLYTEIRQLIWAFSLPTDDEVEPQVCMPGYPCYTYKFPGRSNTEGNTSLSVHLPFPVAMYICHESRKFVLNSKLSGIYFRYHASDKLRLPCRRFRPDIATLYWTCLHPLSELIPSEEYAVLKEVRSLAVAGTVASTKHWRYLSEFPSLERHCMVVPVPIFWCRETCIFPPCYPVKLRNLDDEDKSQWECSFMAHSQLSRLPDPGTPSLRTPMHTWPAKTARTYRIMSYGWLSSFERLRGYNHLKASIGMFAPAKVRANPRHRRPNNVVPS